VELSNNTKINKYLNEQENYLKKRGRILRRYFERFHLIFFLCAFFYSEERKVKRDIDKFF